MKKKDLEYFKNLLTQQLDDLVKRSNDTVAQLKDQENAYSDLLDQASAYTDQSFLLRIKDRESRLINKIKNALDRIEDGTFGICEICDEDIAIGRLKARPVATQCIACKTKMEALEKAASF